MQSIWTINLNGNADNALLQLITDIKKATFQSSFLESGISKLSNSASSALSKITSSENKLNASLKEGVKDVNKMADAMKGVSNTKMNISPISPKMGGKMDKISDLSNNLSAVASTFALSAGVSVLGNNIYEATKQYETYNAVMKNALGSQQAATSAMNMLQDAATKTPAQLSEMVDVFNRLINTGFIPSQQELIKISDVASSQGKSIKEYTEALIDAKTFEFERLKEFGVLSKTNGDKISFTFKGVTTTVNKTSEAVQKYLVGLGDLNGVSGMSSEIMKTMEGSSSNLTDSLFKLYTLMGAELSPIIKQVQSFFSDLIGFIIKNWDWTKYIVFGMAGGLAALSGALLVATTILPIATSLNGLFTGSLWSMQIALDALGIGLILLAIVALGAGIKYALEKSEGFRKTIYFLGNTFKEVFGNIINTLKMVGEGFALIMNGEYSAGFSKLGQGMVQMAINSNPVTALMNTSGTLNALKAGNEAKKDMMDKQILENPAWQKIFREDDTRRKHYEKVTGRKIDAKTGVATPEEVKDKTIGAGTPPVKPTNTNTTSSAASAGGNTGRGGVQVHIQKLVEKIEIHVVDVKMSASQIKSLIEETLTAAVRDAELAM